MTGDPPETIPPPGATFNNREPSPCPVDYVNDWRIGFLELDENTLVTLADGSYVNVDL